MLARVSTGAEMVGVVALVAGGPEAPETGGVSETPGGALIKAGAAGNMVAASIDIGGGVVQGFGGGGWTNAAHSALVFMAGSITSMASGLTGKIGSLLAGGSTDMATQVSSGSPVPVQCK